MKTALILFKYDLPIDDPCCYPLGFMYISAILKQAGHDVTVYNLNLWDEMPDDLSVFDAVLMTGFESFLPQIKALGRECKLKKVKSILGGALATFCPDEMLKYVDTVIIGEGENVISKALNSTGIVHGFKPNLNDLPLPDYEGFGIDEYHRRHKTRYMGVLTSRGCPYSCRFCAQTCAFQFRKLSHVFEEIDFYNAKYGVDKVVFNDNTLNLRKDRFIALCKEMRNRKLLWGGSIRADVWDGEIAVAAKESGCEYLIVGVESFIQEKLNRMNKRIKVEQITSCLDSLIFHGIGYHANTLHGLPDESYQDIINEIMEMPAKYDRVFPGFVQPFVGTEYRDRKISPEQKSFLQKCFEDHYRKYGMTILKEAA